MSEPVPVLPTEPAPAAAPAPAPRRGPAFPLATILAALALALAAFASWQAWRIDQRQDEVVRDAAGVGERNATQLAALARDAARLRSEVDVLTRRAGDADAVNKSLREELLGLGERAALVEDALTSLADKRMAGSIALRLNEAEFLLRLGQERLALFHDPAATTAAFRLADAELAEIDDPLFAGVRQTLAVEIQALAEVPAQDLANAARDIDAIARELPRFAPRLAPAAPDAASDADAPWYSRAARVLGQFVRIRKLDPNDAALVNPLNADLARGAIALELLLAKSALGGGDLERAQSALAQARTRLRDGFSEQDARVQAALDKLDTLLARSAAFELPPLGRTLEELRNLRATRALAQPALSSPPAPAAAEPGA